MGTAQSSSWPYLLCPVCVQSIDEPKDRLRLLSRPWGAFCPHCGEHLCMRGNLWFSYFIGACLLLIAGRLFASDFHFIITLIFFLIGCGVMLWGLLTSRLEAKFPNNNLGRAITNNAQRNVDDPTQNQ